MLLADPPKIITAPLSQSLEEGSEAILFCNASGNPQPNITWTKLGSNSAFPTSGSLTLTNLKKEDDGVYKCLVQNDLGPAEATATVTVLCEYSIPHYISVECYSLYSSVVV